MKRAAVWLVLFLLAAITAQAAKIKSISGSPEIFKSMGDSWQSVSKNMRLEKDDRIRCADRSSVELLTDNGHRVKVWPKSEVEISAIDGRETGFNLIAGKVRSWVKKLRKDESFKVKTPVAVCSVRGTDFSVAVGEDRQSRVEVYEGQVAALEEQSGTEVMVNAGEFSQIAPNQPPTEPKALPPQEEQSGESGAAPAINESKEEARNEIFQEISREEVLARSAQEMKNAEYQNGKAMVDVFGHRVRLEEYIVRTQPNEFKYVVLNTRENRFDFGKILFTFNSALPSDLTAATKNMFHSEGSNKPSLWLTDVISIMSNTVDQVNEEATGGDMYPDNSARPRSWTLGFANYQFLVNQKCWWQYSDNNRNGAIDNGEIFYYNYLNGNKLTYSYDSVAGKYYYLDGNQAKVYFSEFSQPDGVDAFHFLQKNNYAGDQWIGAEDFIINDQGEVVTGKDLRNKTPQDFKDTVYSSNFERVYTASVFQGRKIDLVFSAKLLIDCGILTLPNPKSLGE